MEFFVFSIGSHFGNFSPKFVPIGFQSCRTYRDTSVHPGRSNRKWLLGFRLAFHSASAIIFVISENCYYSRLLLPTCSSLIFNFENSSVTSSTVINISQKLILILMFFVTKNVFLDDFPKNIEALRSSFLRLYIA